MLSSIIRNKKSSLTPNQPDHEDSGQVILFVITKASDREMMEVGMFEKPMRFFDDDGTEINPDLIAKPSLCASCEKDEDYLKEIHAHFDTLITKIDQNV